MRMRTSTDRRGFTNYNNHKSCHPQLVFNILKKSKRISINFDALQNRLYRQAKRTSTQYATFYPLKTINILLHSRGTKLNIILMF